MVARTRIALGTGGSMARDLSFVPSALSLQPSASGAAGQVRRYEARLTGFAGDGEPRDDVRHTAASVSQASAIALFSDAPDWDFRWLARTLMASSGVPVHAYVRLGAAGCATPNNMHPVSDAAVRAEAQAAALVVAHGTAEGVDAMGRLAHRALWQWVTVPKQVDASANGDWYVAPRSWPHRSARRWPACRPKACRRSTWSWSCGPTRSCGPGWWPSLTDAAGRGRSCRGQPSAIGGLSRWARRGCGAGPVTVASRKKAIAPLAASLTDWLLEERAGAPASLAALRDSLARGIGEFLPRDPALRSQPGSQAAAIGEPEPLRFSPWLYVAALVALVVEWVLRRRRGLR